MSQQTSLRPEFTLGSLLSQAWQLQRGTKRAIWGSFIIFITISLSYLLLHANPFSSNFNQQLTKVVFSSFLWLLAGPFYIGAVMTSLCRIRNQPFDVRTGFRYLHPYFKIGFSLLIINMISYIVNYIIFSLISISTLQISPAVNALTGLIMQLIIVSLFCLTALLIVDQSKSIPEAFSISYQKMLPCGRCLKLFLAFFTITLITLIICIPMLYGSYHHIPALSLIGIIIFFTYVIYAAPWVITIQALVYHHLID